MKKSYLIDGTPVTFQELVDKGIEQGYRGDADGVYYTSGVARVLRSHGHIVKENPNPEEVNTHED